MAFDWGSVIGAVGSIASGLINKKSSKDAAKAQTDAASGSNQVLLDMFNQSRADYEPWRQAGLTGLNEYMSLLGLPTGSVQSASVNPAQAYLAANPDVAADSHFAQNPYEHYLQYGQKEGRTWGAVPTAASNKDPATAQQDAFNRFRATPGYQFNMQEGVRALDSSANASGGLFSGKAGKALTKYGQGLADNTYNDYMNRLGSLSGVGQTATNSVAGLGQSTAQGVGSNLLSAGNARASGILGAGQANSNTLNNLGYFANQWGTNSGYWN